MRRHELSYCQRLLTGLGALTLAAGMAGCAGTEPEPTPAAPPAQEPAAEEPAAEEPVAEQRADDPPPEQPGGGGAGGVLEDLARELTLREKEARALAGHYYSTGMRAYEDFDYRKAVENFERALDATPNDPQVRHMLMQAQLLAGDRIAEFSTVAEMLNDERQVRVELHAVELKRLYSQGEQLYDAQEYERAITRFEMVLEKIRWFPYKVDTGDYEESARRYIVQSRRLLREQDLREKERLEEQALAQARLEEERYRSEEKSKLDLLIRRALDQLTLRQFSKAEQTIAEILDLDPQNEEALKLRGVVIENRHIRTRDDIFDQNLIETDMDQLKAKIASVPTLPYGVEFPSKEKWAKIRSRSGGIAESRSEEPAWIRDYRQILSSRKVTLNFPDTPFGEVINFLQDITGLNITVSPTVDTEDITVSLRLREIPLKDALKIVLEQTELAMTFQNETLMITPPDEARGDYYLEIYDVQDLLSRISDFPGDRIKVSSDGGGGGGGGGGGFSFDDEDEEEGTVLEPDQLEEIITNAVGEDNWDDPSSIEIHKGQIIINQTREMHAEIRRVLKNLRRNTGLFVQVETRFVNMNDDFMRDIGVDIRGLGASPNPTFGQQQLLDPNIPTSIMPSNEGPAPAGIPLFGYDMFGGRLENILDSGIAFFGGDRLNNSGVQAANNNKGLAAQITLLDPFQVNAIIRAEEETGRRKIVQAPVITAANRQRVHVSAITQRAYISDYELSSGGTGLVVAEVADPQIQTFQEGVVLDVRPTISSDRKYITLDVRPTLATLVGGSFRQIAVNLGTISNAAINVNIEVPQILLQEAFTSVTLPDGGTALLGGFRKITMKEEHSGVPFIDRIPVLNRLFSHEAELHETASLLILVTARTISLRDEEAKRFNADDE
jgi:Flp pilus assembly secretin CpaC/tetratricopeptide (TPR) repeat protein